MEDSSVWLVCPVRDGFLSYIHPAVTLEFGAFAIILAMTAENPAFGAVALVLLETFLVVFDGLRALARRLFWLVPLIAAISLLNGVFSNGSQTMVASLGPFDVRLEGLLYGLSFGVALAASIEAFAAMGRVVSGDDAISLFGRRLPVCALMLSTTLGLVPRMERTAGEVRDVTGACSAARASAGPGGVAARMRSASRAMTSLVFDAMEDSLVKADSMRARGWDSSAKRTFYRRRRFTPRDAACFAVVLAMGSLAAASSIVASSETGFYPVFHMAPPLWTFFGFALFFTLPLAALAWEWCVWRR